MNLEDFQPFMRVAYVPMHAHGDTNHPDVEHGVVSSVNHKFVFVKFDGRFEFLTGLKSKTPRITVGVSWSSACSQCCDPSDLIISDKPLGKIGDLVMVESVSCRPLSEMIYAPIHK